MYPGCKGTNRYSCGDVQYLVQDYQRRNMRNQDELREYTWAFWKISAVLLANGKLADTQWNILYLDRFPHVLQQKIRECLLIIKQDVHPDDPYPMNDVMDVAKFLLTGSAFRSFLPLVIGNIAPPTPYQPARALVPPFIPTSLYVLLVAIKVETNQVACPPMTCMFCAGPGHMMWMCLVCQAYLNTGKVVRGQFGRLCLPDGTEIPRIQGAQCL